MGKSRLINALVRQAVARTSAAPGKTRLVNLYLVEADRGATAFYLADLPGYGHAGGGDRAARDFDRLTGEYFTWQRTGAGARPPSPSGLRRAEGAGAQREGAGGRWIAGVILAVDARHPGLERDVAAYGWLLAQPAPVALVATKVDKLTQAERVRTARLMETSFGVAAVPVSAVTGEGLDQLWKLLLKWIRRN